MIMDQISKQAEKVIRWTGLAVDGSDRVLAPVDASEIDRLLNLTIDEGKAIDQWYLKDSLDDSSCAALEQFAASSPH